jgi:hypothetical protein
LTPLLQPRRVQVIVIPKGVNNKATTINWARGKERVQGMVVNLIQSLDGQTKKLLKDAYPDTDFTRCLILKEGETPARAGTQLLLIIASTLGIVLSAFYFIVRFIKRRQMA